MPGLDGLRAIAVVAVVLYHSQDLSGISNVLEPQGGFLGVEVFFVVSGYLITALLLREHDAAGTISLKDFWIRRARRLLPALYVFLTGTVALAALFATDAFDKIRREIVGALFYFSNWLLIANDESYFEAAGRPSLFRHLWSLAIEEQFYLIWPMIVIGVLRFAGPRTLLAITMAAVAASTALLWLLFDGVEQYGDVSSVYFRTDARAAALLLGSAAAMVWRPWERTTETALRGAVRWAIDGLGAAALVLLVVMQYSFTDRVIEWATLTRLYHGGFLALSASTVIVIAAVAVPGSRIGLIIGNPVLRWIGQRSYGIYLWHWPVFQLTRPRVDVAIDGYQLLVVRLALTAVLVEASYRLIEMPIRRRAFMDSVRDAIRTPRGIALGTVGALAMILATAGVAAAIPTIDRSTPATEVATVTDPSPSAAVGPSDDAAADAASPTATPTDPAPPPEPAPTVLPESQGASAPAPTAAPTPTVSAEAAALIAGDFDPNDLVQPSPEPTPTQPPLPPPPPLTEPFDITSSHIHIVGDSVIEGAQSQLYRISPTVTVDGRIGRQWWELEGELRQMRSQGYANDVVIIQLGNNGNFTHEMFDGVMNALAGVRLVIFVNIHAPVVWEAEVNAMLARNVNRYAEQARLIDWYSASVAHPEYFIEDGTHLQGPGMVALRYLIENTLLALT